MKITLRLIGKTADKYLEEGISIYQKRLSHYADFRIDVVPDIKGAKNMDKPTLIEKEGKAFLDRMDKRDFLVLLDEKGKNLRSVEFASRLDKWAVEGKSHLVFLVGGAFGFSQEVYDRADFMLSLSPMTFSHQMVRLIFTEQLYRAFTILKGEPYHHE